MEQEVQTAQEVSGNVCFLVALRNILRLLVWRVSHPTRLRHTQSDDDHLVNLAHSKLYPTVVAYLRTVERYTAHRQG
jgi:hypothetical protein